MDSLFLIHFIGEAPELGLQPAGAEQRHVTLLAHILVQAEDKSLRDALTASVGVLCANTPPFTLTAGGNRFFGVNNDISVTLCIDESKQAAQFHQKLFALTTELNVQLGQPEFAGENFSPHISTGEKMSFYTQGDKIPVGTMTMVRHHGGLGGQVEVLANYQLQGTAKKLLICRGLQGSGKTTYANEWVAENPKTRTRISRDEIRMNYFNAYYGDTVNEKAVTVIEQAIMESIMTSHSRDLILDNINMDSSSVIPFLELAAKYGYQVEFKDFNVELTELLRRDENRKPPVSASVIQTYYDLYLIDGLLPPAPTLVY